MQELLKQIEELGLVPVIKIERAQDAVPLAKALCDAGLPCAEVTFRTDAAAQAISEITTAFPDMLVGAGTVLTTEQADTAVKSGARFIVSPGLNPKVVKHCLDKGYPIIPGVATPSEIEQAMSISLNVVKFFPAENAGGLSMIKAMSAPYGNIRFIPTGGINASNLNAYLDFDKIVACGGSWMVKSDLIDSGDFDAVRSLTKQAIRQMLGFSLVHIGINFADNASAGCAADELKSIFGFEKSEGNVSYFASSGLELMKSKGPGTNGHIAIRTNYLNRAYSYLRRKGVKFNQDTAKYDDNGKLVFIYLENEIGGFAVHLVQK